MTNPTPTPPLWREMHKAHMAAADPCAQACRNGYAAELRAVADAVDAHFDNDYVPCHKVVDWLRTEAQRAEAGE